MEILISTLLYDSIVNCWHYKVALTQPKLQARPLWSQTHSAVASMEPEENQYLNEHHTAHGLPSERHIILKIASIDPTMHDMALQAFATTSSIQRDSGTRQFQHQQRHRCFRGQYLCFPKDPARHGLEIERSKDQVWQEVPCRTNHLPTNVCARSTSKSWSHLPAVVQPLRAVSATSGCHERKDFCVSVINISRPKARTTK